MTDPGTFLIETYIFFIAYISLSFECLNQLDLLKIVENSSKKF